MCHTIKGWGALVGTLIAGSIFVWSMVNGFLVQANGYASSAIGMYFIGLVFLAVAKYFRCLMNEDKMPENKKRRR